MVAIFREHQGMRHCDKIFSDRRYVNIFKCRRVLPNAPLTIIIWAEARKEFIIPS